VDLYNRSMELVDWLGGAALLPFPKIIEAAGDDRD
jgi:hypothetical protein